MITMVPCLALLLTAPLVLEAFARISSQGANSVERADAHATWLRNVKLR
jgi:hypothetical protein